MINWKGFQPQLQGTVNLRVRLRTPEPSDVGAEKFNNIILWYTSNKTRETTNVTKGNNILVVWVLVEQRQYQGGMKPKITEKQTQ